MSLTNNINTDHKKSYVYKKGVRQRTLPIAEDFNSINVVKTTVTTTATSIDFPESGGECVLMHTTDAVIYIGGDDTVSTSTGQEVNAYDVVTITAKAGNSNEIYAIVASGTVEVTVTGAENK